MNRSGLYFLSRTVWGRGLAVAAVPALAVLFALDPVEKTLAVAFGTATVLAVAALEVASLLYFGGEGVLVAVDQLDHDLESGVFVGLVVATVHATTLRAAQLTSSEAVAVELQTLGLLAETV